MPKLPRDLSQDQAIRAFVRAGGAEIPTRGKGSHRVVRMNNGAMILIPFRVKTGLLADQIKRAGPKIEEFIERL